MNMPENFSCPENMREHLAKVFSGEYDIPLEGDGYRIIDVGANCGAFAVWALNRWPNSELFCYEPVPETFAHLTRNIVQLTEGEAVNCTQAAVTGREPGEARIWLGLNNCGEASLWPATQQSKNSVTVPTVPPRELPQAHILKLDCEGSEFEILDTLIRCEDQNFHAILVEYHSDELRRKCDAILGNYVLLRAEMAAPSRGTFCYIHHSLISYS